MTTEEKVIKILSEETEIKESDIKPDTKFDELGIDSLDITEVLMGIEEEFDIEIEASSKISSVNDLVKIIEEKN